MLVRRLIHRVFRAPAPAVGGPYAVAAGEVHCTGAVAADMFLVGQRAGEVFYCGAIAGQTDARRD